MGTEKEDGALIRAALALLGFGTTGAVAWAMLVLQEGAQGIPATLWDRAPFLVVAVIGMLLLAGLGKYGVDRTANAIRESGRDSQNSLNLAIARSLDQHAATHESLRQTNEILRELTGEISRLVTELGKREAMAEEVRKLVQDEMRRRNGG